MMPHPRSPASGAPLWSWPRALPRTHTPFSPSGSLGTSLHLEGEPLSLSMPEAFGDESQEVMLYINSRRAGGAPEGKLRMLTSGLAWHGRGGALFLPLTLSRPFVVTGSSLGPELCEG